MFIQRFVPCLVAFIVATLMAILYIDIVVQHRTFADMVLPKLLLPTGLMLLIGAASSAIIAAITERKTAS
ncbi:MAG: hypothetical protein WB973_09560 [Thermoanaerobaculia bacterium]